MTDIGRISSLNLVVVGETNIQERPCPQDALRNVADVLRDADVLIGHMEGMLSPPSQDPMRPDAPYKVGWRHSDPSSVEAFRDAGFAAVNCASNVACGVEAVLDTIKHLDEAGITHCGIGRNRDEAHAPAIFEKKGVKFGMLGYTSVYWPQFVEAGDCTPGAATMKAHTCYQPGRRALEMPGAQPVVETRTDSAALSRLREDILQARDKVDVLVASFHWGISNQDATVDYQREIAHAAVDAGADMVLGHHPHVIQAMEIRNGKPIFYSLGNFAFDWWKMRDRNQDGIVLKCQVDNGGIRQITMLASRRNSDNDVEWVDPKGAEGKLILNRIKELSEREFGTFPGPSFDLSLAPETKKIGAD